MTTSSDMKMALARALLPDVGWPRGLLAFEVEAPRARKVVKRRGRTRVKKTGPRRRADALWVQANEGTIVGYEIKVSRSDVLVELNNLEKAELWQSYCNQWWLFVSDRSLVAGLEDRVPAEWGICTLPARPGWRKLTVIREAPELIPVRQELAFSRLIAWQAWKRYEEGLRGPRPFIDLDDPGLDISDEEAA